MEFVTQMLEDLRWFGFEWSEGPDVGGPFAPYNQSERMNFYRATLGKLRAGNFIYPCICSRKDIRDAVTAPHAADDELVYPGTCRGKTKLEITNSKYSWRFRVPEGETIAFTDGNWANNNSSRERTLAISSSGGSDGVPAYQLACVADDAAMHITEVVRGADLLVSTARQILLNRALGWVSPQYFHCDLMCDESGRRLAKRHDSLSLKTLRERGCSPAQLRLNWRA